MKQYPKFLRLFLPGYRHGDSERPLVIRPSAIIEVSPPVVAYITRGGKTETYVHESRFGVTFRQPGSRQRGYGVATANDLLAAGIPLPA